MPSTNKPKVLIVGAGIGGLTLGAILEKANIPYEIFEKASELKPLGSAIFLGPSVMPMLTQLGVIDKVIEKSIRVERTVMKSEKGNVIMKLDFHDGIAKKSGWPSYIISRPNLQKILLDLIPLYRIHVNSRILSYVETGSRITIAVSDSMEYEGNILVGADGAYSVIRQILYKKLDIIGELPYCDKEPLRYSSICLVGQTRPMEPRNYEYIDDEVCTYESVLMDQKPLFVVTFTTSKKTICWMVVEFLSGESNKIHDNFRSSEWGPEAAEAMCNDVRDIPAVRGLKMGDLIDASPKEVICKVMIEEKLFETWTHGRTVLIGDACHKMHPAAGLGAQSAMCDAVVLANYIGALATVESRDVEKALKDYKDERYEIAKSAVQTSADMANIIKQDRDGKVARFIMNHMPKWLWASIRLKLASYRPQISFLPLIEDRCRVKATHQPSLRRVVLENSDDNKD